MVILSLSSHVSNLLLTASSAPKPTDTTSCCLITNLPLQILVLINLFIIVIIIIIVVQFKMECFFLKDLVQAVNLGHWGVSLSLLYVVDRTFHRIIMCTPHVVSWISLSLIFPRISLMNFSEPFNISPNALRLQGLLIFYLHLPQFCYVCFQFFTSRSLFQNLSRSIFVW